MQRRTDIQASSSIITISIITILLQFAAYSFFDAFLVILGISCLISIVCCHILLEQTATYTSCFQYSILTLFISIVINGITYYGEVKTFLPYTAGMLGIALINWLIPMLHCFFRYMLDYGTRVEDFRSFYRNISIVFLFFYFVVLIYGNFAEGAFPWAYQNAAQSVNFLPFHITATQIEDFLNGAIPIQNITDYLLIRILSFIPYGFLIALTLRGQKHLVRITAFLFVPFVIEATQYFLFPGRCDIDDLFYAFLGGLLGSLLFFLTNAIYRSFSGKDFLADESGYRYHPLHF